MENLKVKVNNESESKEVQELFFELGCKWATCGNSYNNMINIGDYIFLTDWNILNYGLGIGRKEITIQQLKDMVVLKRNSIDDANHKSESGERKYYLTNTESFEFINGFWVNIDAIAGRMIFKPINKDSEVKMKEYLDTSYELRNVEQTSGDNRVPSGWIEIPEGAEEYRENRRFYKNNGKLFYAPYEEWVESGLTNYKTLWQRNQSTTLESVNTSIQDKLKFIEKCLNGEKIQYILGIESDKSQWHNFTEGAMQYIKRSDIKFREAPKYVTINGIEFKNVKSLLKHVKNNFDLEDGE